jgi:hypothetical protein
MSTSTTPFVTPFEGSSLAKAHGKVIEAFTYGNAQYTLKMIRVFYGATARKDIIEECEQLYRGIQRLMATENVMRGYTQHDTNAMAFRQNEVLDERVMQFYFQVTTLLNEKGFTEFMKIKPRVESTPTVRIGIP